jgi:hypothetical protein
LEFVRETKTGYSDNCGAYTISPKLLLLGKWLYEAGFECNEKVFIIPFNGMLIIIPDKH